MQAEGGPADMLVGGNADSASAAGGRLVDALRAVSSTAADKDAALRASGHAGSGGAAVPVHLDWGD